MLVLLGQNSEPTSLLANPDDPPSEIICKKALERHFYCEKIPAKKGGYLKRYIRIGQKLCYVLASRRSVIYHPSTNRRYFTFGIGKRAIEKVDLVILITIAKFREDVYFFDKSEMMQFDGKLKNFFIPDVTSQHKRKPRELPTVLSYANSFNNWNLIKTAE